MENILEIHPTAGDCSENSDKSKAEVPKIAQIIFTPDLHSNIHSLKLKDKEIQDFVYSSILARVQMLKVLELSNVKLINSGKNEQKIYTENLQFLAIECSDFELLSFLIPTSLEHIRIVSTDLRQHEPLRNFLLECVSLIKLELHAVNCDLMNFFTPTLNFPFQLRHLSLVSTLNKIAHSYDNEDEAIKFLNQHNNSIHLLELQGLLPKNVIDFALKRFRLLKSLVLRLNYMPVDADFYSQKRPKKSVKMLTLEGPFLNVQQITGIFKLYPSIHCLHLENIYPDIAPETVAGILKSASKYCTNLYELWIPRLPWLTTDVKFKGLSVIRLRYINTIAELTSILKNAPALRSFHIDHVYRGQGYEKMIEVLLSYNLRSLHISAEPLECMKLFNLVESNPERNLDLLELRARTLNYSKSYQFRFKIFNGNEPNYKCLAEDMEDELKDFIMREIIKLVDEETGEVEDDDTAIVNYVMNSFEFS